MIELDALWKTGKDFLGTRYPIIAGAMTWISDSHFTAAVSEAGAFGSLAAGNMPPELLHEEIQRVRQATDKPFAVNLITIAPNYKEHLRVAAENKVPFIVFAGSFPRRPEIRAAKESGARVMSFASTESIARHLIDNGVDALILEGSEAGGHVGHVSLGILLQQVLFRVKDVPIFTAGGIATGAYIAHLLLMGAARGPAGHVFRVHGGMPNPPALQGGLYPGPGPGCGIHASDQLGPQGRGRARPAQQGAGRVQPVADGAHRKNKGQRDLTGGGPVRGGELLGRSPAQGCAGGGYRARIGHGRPEHRAGEKRPPPQ